MEGVNNANAHSLPENDVAGSFRIPQLEDETSCLQDTGERHSQDEHAHSSSTQNDNNMKAAEKFFLEFNDMQKDQREDGSGLEAEGQSTYLQRKVSDWATTNTASMHELDLEHDASPESRHHIAAAEATTMACTGSNSGIIMEIHEYTNAESQIGNQFQNARTSAPDNGLPEQETIESNTAVHTDLDLGIQHANLPMNVETIAAQTLPGLSGRDVDLPHGPREERLSAFDGDWMRRLRQHLSLGRYNVCMRIVSCCVQVGVRMHAYYPSSCMYPCMVYALCTHVCLCVCICLGMCL
jgi:hypothetical protein